jgi:hypothetical protein
MGSIAHQIADSFLWAVLRIKLRRWHSFNNTASYPCMDFGIKPKIDHFEIIWQAKDYGISCSAENS